MAGNSGHDLEDLLRFLLLLVVVGIAVFGSIGFWISYAFFKTLLSGFMGSAIGIGFFILTLRYASRL